MIVISVDSVAPQRWKNGGGSLRELLLRPADTPWQLRIAVADIDADGPFSEFAGVTRHFTVVDGGGVELTIQTAGTTASHRLHVGDRTLQFDGGAATTCRLLGGRVQALNLMLRGGAGGRVDPATNGLDWQPDAAACGLFTAVPGCCNGIDLPAKSLLWFDSAPAGMRFDIDTNQTPAGPAGWWLAATPSEIRQ